MGVTLLIATLTIILALFVYLAQNLNDKFDYAKVFFFLMIIPMLVAIVGVTVQNSRECVLVFDTDTQTVNQFCYGETHFVAVWLLKIVTWLFYIEIIAGAIWLIYIMFEAVTKTRIYRGK